MIEQRSEERLLSDVKEQFPVTSREKRLEISLCECAGEMTRGLTAADGGSTDVALQPTTKELCHGEHLNKRMEGQRIVNTEGL